MIISFLNREIEKSKIEIYINITSLNKSNFFQSLSSTSIRIKTYATKQIIIWYPFGSNDTQYDILFK